MATLHNKLREEYLRSLLKETEEIYQRNKAFPNFANSVHLENYDKVPAGDFGVTETFNAKPYIPEKSENAEKDISQFHDKLQMVLDNNLNEISRTKVAQNLKDVLIKIEKNPYGKLEDIATSEKGTDEFEEFNKFCDEYWKLTDEDETESEKYDRTMAGIFDKK